jgi:hypothetical protein
MWGQHEVEFLGLPALPNVQILLNLKILVTGSVVGLFALGSLIINCTTVVMWRSRKAYIPAQNHTYQKRLIALAIIIFILHLFSVGFYFGILKKQHCK